MACAACGQESSLEATGNLVAVAPSPGTIPSLLEVQVAPGGGVVVISTPVRPNTDSAAFCASVVFKFRCSVRI